MGRSKKRKRSSGAPEQSLDSALKRLQQALGLNGTPGGLVDQMEKLHGAEEILAMGQAEQDAYVDECTGLTEKALEGLDVVLGWQSRSREVLERQDRAQPIAPAAEGETGGTIDPGASAFNVRALIVDLARHKDSAVVKQYTEMSLWKRIRVEGQRMNRVVRDAFQSVGFSETVPGNDESREVPLRSFMDAYMSEIAKVMENDLEKLRVDEAMGDAEACTLLESLLKGAKTFDVAERALFVAATGNAA